MFQFTHRECAFMCETKRYAAVMANFTLQFPEDRNPQLFTEEKFRSSKPS